MMTSFWPRVRKQKVKRFHRSRRQQVTHRVGTLHPQQPHVAQLGGLTRRAADSTEQPFDPEKVFVRQALRQRAKKRTFAATNIDVQRRFASEDRFQIELLYERITRLRDYSRIDVPAVS
jgi:hypothetical protein